MLRIPSSLSKRRWLSALNPTANLHLTRLQPPCSLASVTRVAQAGCPTLSHTGYFGCTRLLTTTVVCASAALPSNAEDLQAAAAQMRVELRRALSAADFDSLAMMCTDATSMRVAAVAEAGEAARSRHADIDTICIEELARRASLLCTSRKLGVSSSSILDGGSGPQVLHGSVLGWFKAAAAVAFRVPSAVNGAEQEVPLLEHALPRLEADFAAGGTSASILTVLAQSQQHVAAGWLSSAAARQLLAPATSMLELASQVLTRPTHSAYSEQQPGSSHGNAAGTVAQSLLLHIQLPLRVYIALAARPPPAVADVEAHELLRRAGEAVASLIGNDATLAQWISAADAPKHVAAALPPPRRRLAVSMDALMALLRTPQPFIFRSRLRRAASTLSAVVATSIADGGLNELHTASRITIAITLARLLGWRRVRCAALVAELQPHVLAEANAIAGSADALMRGSTERASTASGAHTTADCLGGNPRVERVEHTAQIIRGLVWRLRTLTAVCRLFRLAGTMDGSTLLSASRAGMHVHAAAVRAGLLPSSSSAETETPGERQAAWAAQAAQAAGPGAGQGAGAKQGPGMMGQGAGLQLLPDGMRAEAAGPAHDLDSVYALDGQTSPFESWAGHTMADSDAMADNDDGAAAAAAGAGAASDSAVGSSRRRLTVRHAGGVMSHVSVRHNNSPLAGTSSSSSSAASSGQHVFEADARAALLYSFFGPYADAVKISAATAGKPSPALTRRLSTPSTSPATQTRDAWPERRTYVYLSPEEAIRRMRAFADAAAWMAEALLPPVWPLLRFVPSHGDAAALFGRRTPPRLLSASVSAQQRFAAALSDFHFNAAARALQTAAFAAAQISEAGRRQQGGPSLFLEATAPLRRRLFSFLHYAAFGKPAPGTAPAVLSSASPYTSASASASPAVLSSASPYTSASASAAVSPLSALFTGAELVDEMMSLGRTARTSAVRAANTLHSLYLSAASLGLVQPDLIAKGIRDAAQAHGASDAAANKIATNDGRSDPQGSVASADSAEAAFPTWLARLLLEFRAAGGSSLVWTRLPQRYLLMQGTKVRAPLLPEGASRSGELHEEVPLLSSLPLGLTRAAPAQSDRSSYARSFFEASAFRAITGECNRRGLPPPLLNCTVASLGVEVDVAWPQARLAVAIDGPLHYPPAPVLDIARLDRTREGRPWRARAPATCAVVAPESDPLPLAHLREWIAGASKQADELTATGQHAFAFKAARAAWDGPLLPLDVITRLALRREGWTVACVSILHLPDMFFVGSKNKARAKSRSPSSCQEAGAASGDSQEIFSAATTKAADSEQPLAQGYELSEESDAVVVAALDRQGVWAALEAAQLRAQAASDSQHELASHRQRPSARRRSSGEVPAATSSTTRVPVVSVDGPLDQDHVGDLDPLAHFGLTCLDLPTSTPQPQPEATTLPPPAAPTK